MLITMHTNIHLLQAISYCKQLGSNQGPIPCQNTPEITFAVTKIFVYLPIDYYPLNVYIYGQAFLIETAYSILNPENLLTMALKQQRLSPW